MGSKRRIVFRRVGRQVARIIPDGVRLWGSWIRPLALCLRQSKALSFRPEGGICCLPAAYPPPATTDSSTALAVSE